MSETTRYGFPAEDWERALCQARAHLANLARDRRTTTYGALCEAVSAIDLKPYSFAMVAFLNEVCARADAERGVMLASLVTRKDTGLPGDGYFDFAGSLGRDAVDRRAFWEAEVERVFAAFANEE
ncbi:MAG: hypothetical protein N3B11_00180 [Coriobacteriia bacterium]|nr:hypothetical protein [Coriobacteriia bacterium]